MQSRGPGDGGFKFVAANDGKTRRSELKIGIGPESSTRQTQAYLGRQDWARRAVGKPFTAPCNVSPSILPLFRTYSRAVVLLWQRRKTVHGNSRTCVQYRWFLAAGGATLEVVQCCSSLGCSRRRRVAVVRIAVGNGTVGTRRRETWPESAANKPTNQSAADFLLDGKAAPS
jgi:hypothetical protein